MAALRAFAVVVGLLGAAGAQEFPPPGPILPVPPPPPPARMTARLYPAAALARYDEVLVAAGPPVQPGPSAAARLVDILRPLVFPATTPRAAHRLSVARSAARGELVVAQGSAEQQELVQGVFDLLQREEPPRARLQCSVLTLPFAVAKDLGLPPDVVVPADETLAGRLARAAAKHGGTLRNLPEVAAAPLAPFVTEVAGSAGDAAPRPRVRGEMVPLPGGEVALALRLERVVPAVPPAKVPQVLCFARPTLQLAAGRVAVVLAKDGHTAVAMVVRCVEVTGGDQAAPAGR